MPIKYADDVSIGSTSFGVFHPFSNMSQHLILISTDMKALIDEMMPFLTSSVALDTGWQREGSSAL
jgi:hypothetical protein